MPLDISLHDRQHPMTQNNTVVFPSEPFLDDYEMIIYISEYYINSLTIVSFYMSILNQEVPIDLDTTILNTALLDQMTAYGYLPEQPCTANIYANGEPPLVKLSEKEGLSYTAQLGLDFKCRKNDTSGFY